MPLSIKDYVEFTFDMTIGIYFRMIRYDFSATMFMLGMDIILVDCLINAYMFGGFFFIVFIIHSFMVKANKLRYYMETDNRGL